MAEQQKIEIKLPNGYKLVAEQNSDSSYLNEIFVGLISPDGVWCQDLVIVRNSYHMDSEGQVQWENGQFDILVFGSEDNEDYTEEFNVGLHREEDESDDEANSEESYTAFLYGDDGILTEDLATYDDKDEAVAFVKRHDWNEVINDHTGEVVYKR